MKPYRQEKVASEVRAVVGDAIANRLSDPRISPFVSVTRVSVSGDLAVADVYDALRCRRPYTPAFSEDETLAIIKDEAVSHFDPAVFKAFEDAIRMFSSIHEMFGDEDS